jgi:ribosomal protein S18 acetylase RimI-like enzyme
VSVIIRPAEANDYPRLVPLAREILAEHVAAMPDVFQMIPDPLPEWFFAMMREDSKYDCYVAQADTRIVGFAQLAVRRPADIPMLVPRRIATIENLVVTAAFRGRGIGRALVERCIARAREQHADTLELLVWAFNRDALAFYEHLGLHTENRTMALVL